jgi:glyceraldehyde 3-phosphate dehydrogenase
MIRVGINGLGRIGRAIFRIISEVEDIKVSHINDINPSIDNLVYLIKYDSVYGKLNKNITVKNNQIAFNKDLIKVTNNSQIDKVDWSQSNVDIVIESSGVLSNHESAHKLCLSGIRKVIVTHSSEIVDKTIIFGVNEDTYVDSQENVISSSICDANAVAPVLRLINDNNEIISGNITTLHPWLGYQNLSDGPCRSFAYPGELYENFSLGRASTESLMPKTTSCVDATMHVVPELKGKLISMSFRTPMPIVSSAILNLKLDKKISISDIDKLLNQRIESQKNKVFALSKEALISKDFLQNDFSVIIDQRWTDVDIDNSLRLVLWYDNEWGYSSRVVDLIQLI